MNLLMLLKGGNADKLYLALQEEKGKLEAKQEVDFPPVGYAATFGDIDLFYLLCLDCGWDAFLAVLISSD